MIAGLVERGELSPAWREAFENVPRHRYVPDTIWHLDETLDGPDLLSVHRADDPDAWLAATYANAAVVTQVDDGRPNVPGRGREVTSSASAPGVVARMLAALGVQAGMRVLEIGTGTGWNAALLAHRVGAENVVSVEIDAAVAEHARQRLAGQGYGDVTVITGDGTRGYPEGALYDRVLATVAARQVPYPWVQQTRAGGLLLLPWGTTYYPGGLLRLVVNDDRTATGRIVGEATFMVLRCQRVTRWGVGDVLGGGHVDTSTTELHPWHVAQADPATAIGFQVDCQQFYTSNSDNLGWFTLVDQPTRSWARVTLTGEPPYKVEQAGPRRLFDEVAEAYRWWHDVGEPAVADWLVTVDRDGQRVKLNGQ